MENLAQNSLFLFDGYLIEKGGLPPVIRLISNLEYHLAVPDGALLAIFRTKSGYFVNFLSGVLVFMLFLKV